MRLDIKAILKTKAKQNKLHNLYLIEPGQIDSEDNCISWTHDLIQEMINESKTPKSIENHSDILILKQTEENKLYQMSDIEEISNFLHYKAQEYSRKIIIIEKASALSVTHINKLLKTFEEPPINLTIFLVNSNRKNLMATLYSRAIQIKIDLNSNQKPLVIDDAIRSLDFFEFSNRANQEKWKISELIQYIHQCIETESINYNTASQIQNSLAMLDEDLTYNNGHNSQLYNLSNCLQLMR